MSDNSSQTTNGSNRDREEPINEVEMDIDTPAPAISLSLNAMFELLAHHHRRDLLRFLIGADDRIATVDEIATHLITQEAQRTGRQPGHDQIETALHHTHLPKLAEAGVIDYTPGDADFDIVGDISAEQEAGLEQIREFITEYGGVGV